MMHFNTICKKAKNSWCTYSNHCRLLTMLHTRTQQRNMDIGEFNNILCSLKQHTAKKLLKFEKFRMMSTGPLSETETSTK